jgi:hypothetical protein
MNTETKIAFRQLLSDVLMFMMETGRDRHEILSMLDKLETAVEKLINTELSVMLPGCFYLMDAKIKTEFRLGIAGTLDAISKPGVTPEKVMELIRSQEGWANEQIELALKKFAGKPKMYATRLPNKSKPN